MPGTNAKGWMEESWNIGQCYDASQAEMFAQAEAMALAVKYLEEHDIRNAVVQIFTDSQTSIDFIRKGISDSWFTGSWARDLVRPILTEMAQLSERLQQRGCTVQTRWLKRSSNTKNYQADARASAARTDQDAVLSSRNFATRNLDDDVQQVAERWVKKRQNLSDPWNHAVYRAELVACVIELRRLAIAIAPEPLSFELQLELNRKDNLVGYLLD
ncbi:hypothetical protein QBC37DRAFT_375725 [Rhypophila decipiens]|uniref:RNase H type-1 domain-containing protein n=1 Tax=Rhypophila decipiens TaxID=261697 RepID=A0AAN6Y818_9PEZI|nr:hypothetical protein QBC37DRAFT_375725 [Rhypophila decipiens]